MAGTLFQGKFLAMPGESMFQIDLAQPVGLVKSHFNQLVYLIVGCYTALAIPAKFERLGFVTGMNVLDRIFVGLTLSSTFFVVWQLLGEHGVPYPADLIHVGSRAGAFDQAIAGVKRISGSYAEPSSLGGEVGVALCYLLARSPLATGARLRWFAIAGGLLCIMVSTSTSGLAMLACALACGGMAFILRAASPSQGGQAAQSLKELAAFAPLIGLAVLGSLFLLSLPQTRDVLYEILFNKTRTGSFIERQASNNLAGALFSETSGLGVGLGGHVASRRDLDPGRLPWAGRPARDRRALPARPGPTLPPDKRRCGSAGIRAGGQSRDPLRPCRGVHGRDGGGGLSLQQPLLVHGRLHDRHFPDDGQVRSVRLDGQGPLRAAGARSTERVETPTEPGAGAPRMTGVDGADPVAQRARKFSRVSSAILS